jgi:hypothetical protein
MSYITVEVEIEAGRIIAREPASLPAKGTGLLTILPLAEPARATTSRNRVQLPLIHGDGKRMINPTAEELDKSAWE